MKGPAASPAAVQHDVGSADMEEIPPQIAERMSAMISDMKMRGQIPADANEMQMMKTLHRDMLKEREQFLLQRQLMQPPAGQRLAPAAVPAGDSDQQEVDFDSIITLIKDFVTMCSDSHGCKAKRASSDSDHQNNPFFRDLIKSAMESIRKNRAAVNEEDPETGDTALHLAISHGMELLVRLLVSNSADVNRPNKCQQTPVHYAAHSGQIMTIELLLKAGADLSLKDNRGWTALHHAAAGAAVFCPQTVHYLTFCHGLSYTDLSDDGWTPLHVIASISKENNIDLVNILLSQPQLDVLLADVNGNTALHLATETAQSYLCYELVNNTGAKSLLLSNRAGKTPLDISRATISMQGFLLGREMESWLEKGPNHRPKDDVPFAYRKYLYLPIGQFLLCVLLSHFLTPSSQGWLCAVGMMLLLALVFLPSHRLDHPSRRANPSRFGGVTGAFVLTTYLSVVTLLPATYLHRPLTCLLLVLSMASTGYLFVSLIYSDPGFTRESKRKETGEFYTMRDLVQVFQKPGIWCSACQLIPTKPTKHCKLCNRCVYWMDHHCLYFMTCVGYNTHYRFVWYNIALVTTQICYLSLLYTYLHLNYLGSGLFDLLVGLFLAEGFLFVVSVAVLGFCFFTVPLLCRNLYNVGYGYTTFFKPRGPAAPADSSADTQRLSLKDNLLNVSTFLTSGRIRSRDPAFKF